MNLNADTDPNAERSRRESHNAVERRRREAINQGIGELGDLLASSGVVQMQHKMNKGTILGKAVEYIGFLQSVNQQMAEKMKDTTQQQADELNKLAQELTELATENEQLKLRLAFKNQPGAAAMLSQPQVMRRMNDDDGGKRPGEEAPQRGRPGRKRKVEVEEE
eukprot:comp20822_c0_seq1/m.27461 comp20822_c0_seq1/g.27461  ORF comp20822_c0_seq1/g.27461 comp20822_c0_seq1/m.27461 type:complete len:164 (-) comp20822_c0_seq1:491-982(-)